MPKKKLQEVAPEPETVEAATETQEVAPEPAAPEVSEETVPEVVDNSENKQPGVTEINETTHSTAPVVCWYVWNEKTEFVKSFHEDDHHGEAKKQAEAFASDHEGWTVTA